MPPKLAAHLEERGCLPVLYMSSWLLTVFASAFPLSFASRVMDVLLTDSYSEPMMRVRAAALYTGSIPDALNVDSG
jgi:Rab-GTPase-TBC domain